MSGATDGALADTCLEDGLGTGGFAIGLRRNGRSSSARTGRKDGLLAMVRACRLCCRISVKTRGPRVIMEEQRLEPCCSSSRLGLRDLVMRRPSQVSETMAAGYRAGCRGLDSGANFLHQMPTDNS